MSSLDSTEQNDIGLLSEDLRNVPEPNPDMQPIHLPSARHVTGSHGQNESLTLRRSPSFGRNGTNRAIRTNQRVAISRWKKIGLPIATISMMAVLLVMIALLSLTRPSG